DSHTTPARDIRTGFDREDHAGVHQFLVRPELVSSACPPGDLGVLVDVDPEPMAGPVTERFAQAARGQGVPGCGVNREPRAPRGDSLNCKIVRFEHRSMYVASPRRRPP